MIQIIRKETLNIIRVSLPPVLIGVKKEERKMLVILTLHLLVTYLIFFRLQPTRRHLQTRIQWIHLIF